MKVLLAAVVSASPLLYEAHVPTFGCNSGMEVLELQRVRADPKAFEQLLTVKASYGQCVTIPQGTVVEGPAPSTDSETTLLINAKNDPPGYRVPSKDFKVRGTDAQP